MGEEAPKFCEQCHASLVKGYWHETSGGGHDFCSQKCQRLFHGVAHEAKPAVPSRMMHSSSGRQGLFDANYMMTHPELFIGIKNPNNGMKEYQ